MSIYLDLTAEFNAGRLRTIVCSGQAVVLLRLQIASKDGDWILREDQEAIDHVLRVLEDHGARYRFGAPMDLRWLRAGWSCHFQFPHAGLRIRTDFFSRPPRIPPTELASLWQEQEGRTPPFTGPAILLRIKQTAREKDWPIVGELARLLPDARSALRWSRSPRDLMTLAAAHPHLCTELLAERPALAAIHGGLQAVRAALDQERYVAMDTDAARIRCYLQSTRELEAHWSHFERVTAGLPLRAAHRELVVLAERCLPTTPSATSS